MPEEQPIEVLVQKRNMKLDTAVIVLKFAVPVLSGFLAVWAAGVKPYVQDGNWPPTIALVGDILPLALVAALTAAGAYLSKSWSQYDQQKKANDSGVTQTVVTEPTAPTVEVIKP